MAKERAQTLRLEHAYQLVQSMPIERIREVTQNRLRISPLNADGSVAVADLLGPTQESSIRTPGVGPKTAQQAI